ncbi:GNAT family N-acetyltransferase [Lachnospiraceae bacterium JLR.KK008]
MIRRFRDDDVDAVMSIWLNANLEAHTFIASEYWLDNYDAVKKMIPGAEVWVSENGQVVDGFIGMTGDYIAGIFVDKTARAKGIGSELLRTVQKDRKRLKLRVYRRNTSAIDFYSNRGFLIEAEYMDAQTSEWEYGMVWKATE